VLLFFFCSSEVNAGCIQDETSGSRIASQGSLVVVSVVAVLLQWIIAVFVFLIFVFAF